MTKFFLTLFAFFSALGLYAQDTYLVYFKSKEIKEENLALSKEAVIKRRKLGIKIDEKDYKIESNRVQSIETITPILHCSKWLNAVSISATPDQIEKIKKLTFVASVDILKSKNVKKSSNSKLESEFTIEEYGQTYPQLNIHQANLLHDAGYLGQGMKIAVFDAGFNDLDKISSFNHLFLENRVFPIYNYVEDSKMLFLLDGHGTNVMGCMSSYIKDTIIASAPKASYYLFITEDPNSESRLEEFNWVVAAEMADSLGIDIINSSLGYAEFDDPKQNYTRAQMDGKTTIISKAASIACDKGIVVVSSAGNLGNKSWHIISAPADAEKVISVGGIDINKNIADFSSRGYNALNQIKPNVVSVGKGTTMLYNKGNYSIGNGTSFSGPLMTGMIACFWQKNPHLKPDELRLALYKSSTNFASPNEEFGYGIPEFKNALDVNSLLTSNQSISIYPNPTQKTTVLEFNSDASIENSEVVIYSGGKEIMKSNINLQKGINHLYINTEGYSRGIYFVKVKLDNSYFESRFEKN